MKPKSTLRSLLAALGAATIAISSASADSYTWTALTPTAPSTMDWTDPLNWSGGNQYVSDAANELIFFSDSTTTIAVGTRNITTNVPATLSMNTLTLNGKGFSSGASSSVINIASSASTWTIGDGTTSTVNLNANQGATTAAGFNYNVAANLTLNQATTLFTGNGTGGVHTGNNDTGFVFSGSIGEAAAGYGITKSGSSRLTLSNASLTFTGPLTVNGGSLFLTGNSNLPSGTMTVNSGAILRIGNNTATQIGTSGNYAGNISTGTGGTLQLWSSSAQEFSGIISGSGGINKAFGGTLTLSGANTYTGKTEFRPVTTAGFTVNVSSFNSVVGGTANSSLGAPTTVANGTIDLGSGAAQATVNLTYVSTATGETTDRVINLQYNGTSNRIITANNASGVLRFTSAFTSNGGTQNGKLILGGTGAGQIDQGLPQLAALGLDKQGAGTWTLGGSGLFTSPTLITAGTLSLSSATALQFSPYDTTSVAGGASAGLKIATTTLSLGGLTGSNAFDTRFTTALGGPSNATAQGGYAGLTALTLTNAANTTSTYSGNIVEGATGMTLTKNGTGTQFLNGTNSYTGLTTINSGTLGSGTGFSGSVTVNGSGIAPGASAGAFGTLTISDTSSSALTLNSGNLLMDVSTGSSDLIAVTGDAVLNGTNTVFLNPTTGVDAGSYDLVTYNATTGSGSVVFANGTTTLGNATLAVNAGNIRMTVGAGGLSNSVWSGASGTWDSGTNWNRNGAAGSSFSAGDFVTFDDSGTTLTVTSAGTVSPAQITFNNSTKNYVMLATIGGTGTPLVKMGTGTTTLGSTAGLITNTYTGGTVILGGILTLAGPTSTNLNPLLGDDSGGIILNGGQLRVSSNNLSGARNVMIGASGGSLFVNKNNNFTTTGILSGSGTLTLLDGGGAGTLSTYNFNSTSNDFTGGLVLNNAILNIGRLDDSSNNIIINSNTSSATGNVNATPGLKYTSGAASALTLSSRAIEFSSAVTSAILIQNNNTTHAITVSSDLVAAGAGTKTLMLDAAGGVGSPTNVFSGDITDGTGGGTVGVVKPSSTGVASNASTSTWVLSGNNSYTGATAINTGTLAGIGANAFGNTSGISMAAAGILSLRGDSSTTFPSSNVTTSASGATINVDQATIAGTGAKTMTMGTIGTISTAATYQVNFTGANNTSLSTGTVTLPTTASVTTHTISNTIAVGGDLTLAGITGGGTTTGTLVFSNNGNTTVTGAITQAGSAQALTKNGTGTLLLNGTNSYTGLTTVSAGTLGGAGLIAGDVTVAAAGSLAPGASAGTLTIGGGLNISAQVDGGAGKLKFELGTNTATSDQIAVTGTLTTGGKLGFSDFTFTDLPGGPQNGTYTLITTGADPTGSLDGADLSGSIGVGGTGTLSVSGNNVVLTVTGLGGASPYDTWSGGAAFDADANGDGIDNGLAFLLGAANPNANALGLLPTVTQSGGGLILQFNMLNSGERGTASLTVQHSSDLDMSDAWEAALVPDSDSTVNDVVFDITAGSPTNGVQATIPSSKAAGGKLFGRLKANP